MKDEPELEATDKDEEWARAVEESILLTSGNSIFDYNQRDTEDCNTVENEAREMFGAEKEYDWALAIGEEHAEQEWREQKELSSEEGTLDEIAIEPRESIELVEEEVPKKVERKRRRREEDMSWSYIFVSIRHGQASNLARRPSSHIIIQISVNTLAYRLST